VLYRHPALLLTTTGRRTGLPRQTPLAVLIEPEGTWLITGGAGGQTRTPDWVANLRADPHASITIDRRDIDVTATGLLGEQRDAVWATLTQRWRALERYERVAGRAVPVFRLAPR
jgi:deazaflavin-dependent oxidoreductase (nitroreductase family)